MRIAVPSKALTSCVTANTVVKQGRWKSSAEHDKCVVRNTRNKLHKSPGDHCGTQTSGAVNTNNLGMEAMEISFHDLI